MIVGEGAFQMLFGTNALYSQGANVSFEIQPLRSPEFSIPMRIDQSSIEGKDPRINIP